MSCWILSAIQDQLCPSDSQRDFYTTKMFVLYNGLQTSAFVLIFPWHYLSLIKSLQVSLISTRPLKVLTYLSSSDIGLVSSSHLDHGNRFYQRIALGPPFVSPLSLSLSPLDLMPSKFPFQHHFFNAQQKSLTKTKPICWHTTYMYIST